MGWSAFSPKGTLNAIAVGATASTAIQAPGYSGEPQNTNYIVANSTTQACFLSYGPTAAAAQANAVVPTGTGVLSFQCVWLPPNSVQSLTFPSNAFFSSIAPATTSVIYIMSGDGL